jgi:hypothetical protein
MCTPPTATIWAAGCGSTPSARRWGASGVLKAAKVLARQSQIPRARLMLIDRQATYAHNDPNSAFPRNAFVKGLTRFLARVQRD